MITSIQTDTYYIAIVIPFIQMSNYRYTLTKTAKRSKSNKRRKCNDDKSSSIVVKIIEHVPEEIDVNYAILKQLLNIKRSHRLRKLTDEYKDTTENVEAFRAYLPMEYKQYANNPNLLLEQLASMYEITHKYNITNVEAAPDSTKCYGCLYDCMGQKDHMECNTGCLHDPQFCYTCEPTSTD